MAEEIKRLVKLLIKAERELDAWRDANPDRATHGDTTKVIDDIRDVMKEYPDIKTEDDETDA